MSKADLITVEQAARRVGFSVLAVRQWVRDGRLTPICREGAGNGGQIWLLPGDVDALVQGVCPMCGTLFQRRNVTRQYCSESCRKRASWLRKNPGRPTRRSKKKDWARETIEGFDRMCADADKIGEVDADKIGGGDCMFTALAKHGEAIRVKVQQSDFEKGWVDPDAPSDD